MQLRNCADCGKVFVHPTRDVCQSCHEDEEQDFEKVKEFLWDKTHSSVDDVHEKTGVTKKRIIKFIRQGRILAEGLDVELFLSCESCGQPISEGSYCKECREKLLQGLTEEVKRHVHEDHTIEPQNGTGRMHLQHRRKR